MERMCPACQKTKPIADFYEFEGEYLPVCKHCQRTARIAEAEANPHWHLPKVEPSNTKTISLTRAEYHWFLIHFGLTAVFFTVALVSLIFVLLMR